MATVTPQDLKPRLTGAEEIAFVDVREHGQFGEGHPFFAVNIPYSRLELRLERLLPRRTVPVVLLDSGDGVAERARARMPALGYTDVAVMDGGAPGWAAAGFTLYKGVNLPSKTFGELVEQTMQTPSITPDELHARRAHGDDLVLLDGRTPAEYARMTVPGARSCPNAELGHRLPALLSNSDTTVVVNCAGRTRSIIGAQSLITLGVGHPVVALENGTQGWTLAGYELKRGAEPQPLPALDAAAIEQSRQRARTLMARYELRSIGLDMLQRWRGDAGRTLYLFDVRTAEEYAAGHIAAAQHAPGGQLVQATDEWVAVRGSRIVLSDDTALRAAVTAMWLSRMGHDVYVLADDVTALDGLESGAAPVAHIPATLDVCQPSALAERLAGGAVLLDLRASMDYLAEHIDGARWAIRPRLPDLGLDDTAHVVLAGERSMAELAAIDLRALGCTQISWLAGNPEDWAAAGLAMTVTPDQPADGDCIDYLFFVHDRHRGNREAMRGYLDWETALIGQLDAQERGVFAPEL